MGSEKVDKAESTFYWHYAWIIVVIIAGMQIVGTSIRMSFGVFIDPLQIQFGWSQGGIGLAYAFSSIVSALVSPSGQESMVPIQVMICIKCDHVNDVFKPSGLKEEETEK